MILLTPAQVGLTAILYIWLKVLLQNINQNIDGFQMPTLGPVRNFDKISGEFIQILHTGNKHWVCASNIGCVPETVNIYDSLYHNVVEDEIKDQILSMLGHVFSGIEVIPVQPLQLVLCFK